MRLRRAPSCPSSSSTGKKTNAAVIEANLTAEGRTYVALDFCQKACSVRTSLPDQVQMAIEQVREIIAKDTATYTNGYHFLAHSQGGSIARGVVEEMDDHNVHSLISLADDGNGNFYGPQASEEMPLQVMLKALGPYAFDATDFNFTKYEADPATWKGKFQRDFAELVITNEKLQGKSSIVNSFLPPLEGAALDNWLKINPFLPKIRRKANFVKLKAAHFFVSPQDDLQSPWQTAVLGKYTTVATVDEIETKFSDFTLVEMKDTVEYTKDLYGLKTLDTTGELHLHEVPNVPHNCWLFDYTSLATNVLCNAEIYPVLV